jgi:transcription initiation factor TFIID subunit 5
MASSASPSQSAEASAAQNSAPTGQPDANLDSLVLEYLRARGHSAAAEALQNDSGANSIAGPSTIDSARFARELAKFSNRPEDEEIEDASEPGTLQLLASVAAVGAEEILSSDPTDKYQGFRELEAWVDGSLDMYRVRRRHGEYMPPRPHGVMAAGVSSNIVPHLLSLLPRPCRGRLPRIWYAKLQFLQVRRTDEHVAQAFYRDFSSSLAPTHQSELHHISNLLLPMHVQQDELAQRFRDNKYTVRMSRSGFGLLVGWLTEGMGGEVTGAGTGFSGEKGKRGRSAVMRVVNNHLRFDGMSCYSLDMVVADRFVQ